MNHIELFAGCGGLSLGLETAGFRLLLANELSPMAAETFAHNHLNADLETLKNIDKVLWISSTKTRSNIPLRLREDPNKATGLSNAHHSDLLDSCPSNESLARSLLVGSIIDLNSLIDPAAKTGRKNRRLLNQLKSGLGEGHVDLVSGGPPCQSFSLAGMRDPTHHRNQLPGEFAKFVGLTRPRIALLENVSGILRAFNIDGNKVYAWFEAAKAFAKEAYVPICLHVNAKYTGTAQNRPRFIMIALREDVYRDFKNNSLPEDILSHAFKQSEPLMKVMKKIKKIENKFQKGKVEKKDMESEIYALEPNYPSIKYFDVEKDDDFFRSTILSPLVTHKDQSDPKRHLVGVGKAIDDLRSKTGIPESSYVKKINGAYIQHHNHPLNKYDNHEPRENKAWVRARFRIYQIMNKLSKEQSKEISRHLKNHDSTSVSDATLKSISEHWLLDLDGNKLRRPAKSAIVEILGALHTKKQTQRALIKTEPAPAALSIPDDACHYHESVSMQRTLTVREMTRIQSFPDWYRIKSKVTTGGKMRRYEVPQYTQVGNAVPPLLGVALGEICESILKTADQ